MSRLPAFLLFVLSVLPLSAAWRTERFELQPGWNGIYSFVDASHLTLDELLAPHAEITEVWRWQPERGDARLVDPTLSPASGIEWAIWKRDSPGDSTFNRLRPNFAYLVRVADSAAPLTLAVKGRAILPQIRWRSDGLNLIGLPVSSARPLMANYLAPSGISLSQSRILEYVGGPITQGTNPKLVNPNLAPIVRGRAYWVNDTLFSRYYGPVKVELDQGSGIHFGSEGYQASLILSNLDEQSHSVTLSLEPSETSPQGQTRIAGSLPVAVRSGSGPISLASPFTLELAAGERRRVELHLDRLALGGNPGETLASLLRIQSGAEDIYLPAVAEKTSFAGLWVGTARIDRVASVLKRYRRDAAGNTIFDDAGNPEIVEDLTTPLATDELPGTDRPYDLRLIVHVTESGTATLLSHVYQGALAYPVGDTTVGLTMSEEALDPAELDRATRLSVAHLPLETAAPLGAAFGPGGSASTTIATGYRDDDNPFVHAYHPDHDNLDARFENTLPAGVESFDITRAITLEFDAGRPDGVDDAWGSTLFTGTYREDIDGVHKNTLRSQGAFALYKVSSIGALSQP